MSTRLNWPGSRLDGWNYADVAWYFAAFCDMTSQDPTCVLTKQEYIARAGSAYDKLGPRDDHTDRVSWDGNDQWDIKDETFSIALTKIGDPRRLPRYPPVALREGHCEMFLWSDYNDDFGDPYDFA